MPTINFELTIIYIALVIGAIILAAILAFWLCRNKNWQLNYKATYGLLALIILTGLAFYSYFGAAKELVAKNFLLANHQELADAKLVWQNQPEKIIKILEAKLKAKPKDLTARRLLVGLYLRTKQYTAADLVLHDLDPSEQTLDLQLLMAEVKYRQNHPTAAKALLSTIIDNPLVSAEILWFAGKLALAMQDKPLTIRAWRLARAKLVLMQVNPAGLDQALDRVLET